MRRLRRAPEPEAIVMPSGPKGINRWRNRGRDLSTAGQTPLAAAALRLPVLAGAAPTGACPVVGSPAPRLRRLPG